MHVNVSLFSVLKRVLVLSCMLRKFMINVMEIPHKFKTQTTHLITTCSNKVNQVVNKKLPPNLK